MLSAIVNINMGFTIYYMSGGKGDGGVTMGRGGMSGCMTMVDGWIRGEVSDWECSGMGCLRRKLRGREEFTSHRSFLTGG
jgi:hypothetical protein